jgi:hypothetical protein
VTLLAARLRSATFTAATHARIEVPAQPGVATALPGTGGMAIRRPGKPVDLTFTVTRLAADRAATVPITVVDGCGEWKTFVGGGAGAGF